MPAIITIVLATSFVSRHHAKICQRSKAAFHYYILLTNYINTEITESKIQFKMV